MQIAARSVNLRRSLLAARLALIAAVFLLGVPAARAAEMDPLLTCAGIAAPCVQPGEACKTVSTDGGATHQIDPDSQNLSAQDSGLAIECMTVWIRYNARITIFSISANSFDWNYALQQGAQAKLADIQNVAECNNPNNPMIAKAGSADLGAFEHEACGRPFYYWDTRAGFPHDCQIAPTKTGYCPPDQADYTPGNFECNVAAEKAQADEGVADPGAVLTENLGWGTGALGTPLQTMDGWLKSPGHRANLLEPSTTLFGAAGGKGYKGEFWYVEHFAYNCDIPYTRSGQYTWTAR